jgi:uncharacterized membrane-anchored protein YhcB (DUF1043 family)
MQPDQIVYLIVAAGVVFAALAYWLGRRSGGGSRVGDLVAEVERVRSEYQEAYEEARALREELVEARQAQEQYRLDVVEHFSGTSDLLRDMTVQYRAVYEHLTQGASTLCPEGFVGLTEGLPVPQIEPTLELLETDDDFEATAEGLAAPSGDLAEDSTQQFSEGAPEGEAAAESKSSPAP